MLDFIKRLFVSVPQYTPVEKWALKNSQKTSPEEIIVAAVIQSFAKDYDKWEDDFFTDPKKVWSGNRSWGLLEFKAKQIRIKRHSERKGDKYRFHGMSINEIDIPPYLEKAVVDGWNKIAVRVKQAEEAAKKAKQSMDKNEAAWNLAENLLNMRRDSNGALVPQEQADA